MNPSELNPTVFCPKETLALRTSFLIAALSLSTACATPPSSHSSTQQKGTAPSKAQPRGSSAPASQLSDEAGGPEVIRIQSLFDGNQHAALLDAVQKFDQKHKQSRHRIALSNLKGLSLLALGRPAEARAAFEYSLREAELTDLKEYRDFRPFYLYNLAAAQEQSADLSGAFETLSRIQIDRLDLPNRTKFHGMKARLFVHRRDLISASGEYIKLSRLIPGEESNAAALWVRPLEQAARQISDPSELEKLSEAASDSPAQAILLWALGSLEERSGKRGSAEGRYQRIVDEHATSPYRVLAEQKIATASAGGPKAQPYTIGALLPLTGKYARFGQKALQGLQLALGIFTPADTSGKAPASKSPFTLIVEDSGDSPEQTLKAYEKLTQTHRVLAVVGPLLSKGAEQLAEAANQNQIPLISLAQQTGGENDYLFSLGLTPRSQALEIAHYAIRQLNLRRFAILHPQDRFGEQYAQAFWDAVEELGGEIRGIESYAPGETDFRTSVDRLSGLFYGEARSRELKSLAEQRSDQQIKKRNRKTEKFFSLPPIVDYDAVFIPDEPKAIGLAVPTFSYRDVDGIKFLGTATWHSQDLGGRLQAMGPHSFFPDAFNATSTAPDVQKFVADYRGTFNQDPTAMEAIAYDAGRILKNVIQSGNPDLNTQPKALRNALSEISEFSGVSGRVLQEQGRWKRLLRTYTLKSGQVIDAP